MSVAVAFCALIRFVLNRMQLLPIEWFQLHLAIGEAALGVAVLLIHIALRIQALIVASWADAAASASASASASATATFESLMTALTVTRFLLVLSFHVDALFPTCISTFHAFVSTHQILSLRVSRRPLSANAASGISSSSLGSSVSEPRFRLPFRFALWMAPIRLRLAS